MWNGHTSQISTLEGELATSGFMSGLHAEHLGGVTNDEGVTKWEAQQYHFHSPSEHTFNGKYCDLEMHTVHYPRASDGDQGGYIAAALGIMFDVNDYTAQLSDAENMVIDNFFESLQWDEESSEAIVSDLVAYGDLVNVVDFHNRWIYQGSVTTPPCAQKVFWNELSTIYPIAQKHVDNFKK